MKRWRERARERERERERETWRLRPVVRIIDCAKPWTAMTMYCLRAASSPYGMYLKMRGARGGGGDRERNTIKTTQVQHRNTNKGTWNNTTEKEGERDAAQ